MSSAEAAELIVMLFRMLTFVGLRNYILDGSPNPPGAILRGKGRTTVKYRDSAVSCPTVAELIEMSFRIWTWVGPRNHVVDGGPDLRV